MGGDQPHPAPNDREAVRAVVFSAILLGLASALEFVAASAGHSAGVLADALHNAGDVVTTAILLAAFALARRPATRRFPSGFGRIEDVATLLIVLVIVVTAALAAYQSLVKLFAAQNYGNALLSLAAALFATLANLAVSIYKIRVGRSVGSTALVADGIHSRIDALVSAGAFAGVGLALLGLPLADPIAGLAITGMICYILAGTVRQLFERMMDAVHPQLLEELAAAARRVEGVLGVHDVRARWLGRELAAVMHVDCRSDASLQEAHEIALRVEQAIARSVPEARVDIHMDPGPDEHVHSRPPAARPAAH